LRARQAAAAAFASLSCASAESDAIAHSRRRRPLALFSGDQRGTTSPRRCGARRGARDCPSRVANNSLEMKEELIACDLSAMIASALAVSSARYDLLLDELAAEFEVLLFFVR
jgi:hypothetical protein